MKKARVIFYLIVSLVLLFAMTCKSSAMTISSSSTPNTVDSGAEFYITLKLDEPVTSFNAHINYDSDLFTISDKAETANTTINPTYAKGDASFLYTALDGKTTLDTFKIKVKAAEVTEEKSATFTVSNMEAVTTTAPNGERLDKMTFSVSIKPTEKKEELTISESTVNLKIGESKTLTTNSKGTLEWSSSNEKVATVDNTGKITAVGEGNATITVKDENGNTKTVIVNVTKVQKDAPKQLAKTGEGEILAMCVCGTILLVTIFAIKFKKINKLFVLLPLVLAVSFGFNISEAAEIKNGTKLTKNGDENWAYIGIIENTDELKNKKAIGITPNSGFFAKWETSEGDVEGNNIVEESDLTEVLKKYGIENPTYTYQDKKRESERHALATGDIIKDKNNEEYTLIIYGDGDSEGTICQSAEFGIIIDDYVNGNIAEGYKKMAVDINLDGNLNVLDISKLIWKYNGYDGHQSEKDNYLGQTLVGKDPFKEIQPTEDEIPTIEIENSDELKSAVDSISKTDKTKIKLLKDINVSGNSSIVEIGEDLNIILDLNGKNITYTGTSDAIVNSGNLTITNSNTETQSVILAESAVAIKNKKNLTITGNIKIQGNPQSINCDGSANETTLNIDGEKVLIETAIIEGKEEGEVIYLNENCTATIRKATINAIEENCAGIRGAAQSSDFSKIKVIMESGAMTVAGDTAFDSIGELTLGNKDVDNDPNDPIITISKADLNNDDNLPLKNIDNLNFYSGTIKTKKKENLSDIKNSRLLRNIVNIVVRDNYTLCYIIPNASEIKASLKEKQTNENNG